MKGRRSGILAAWANAWLAGQCGTSEVIAAVEHATGGAPDGAHRVLGLEDAAHRVLGLGDGLRDADEAAGTLQDLLLAWRRAGTAALLVLPVAGDVRGLAGPAVFRAAAVDVGEAVVGAGFGVVPTVRDFAPSSARTEVIWHAATIDSIPTDYIQLSDAQRDLTEAIRTSAEVLMSADVAGTSGDIAPELHEARRVGEHLVLPRGFPAPAVALLAQAERMQAVLDLASRDVTGGTIDAAGAAARTAGLRPLSDAVRRARVAAYNSTGYALTT